MKRLKQDDDVIIIAGKDKGKTGKLVRFTSDDKVIVSGVNMVKKHVKPNPQKNIKGGIEQREAALHASNVALFNAETQKADKVSYQTNESGKKIRVFRSNQKPVDVI